jgi:hypothetical protein
VEGVEGTLAAVLRLLRRRCCSQKRRKARKAKESEGRKGNRKGGMEQK